MDLVKEELKKRSETGAFSELKRSLALPVMDIVFHRLVGRVGLPLC